ncbi:MAG: CapA family protein [Archangium sp.]|nr:CapA family protein [Archangium sp.]MDP3153032.1 CapA family protein [Archangium sp.]MDP3572580.1 CapA family protein [Archangium sp.]
MLTTLVFTLLAQAAPARVTFVFGGDVIPHDPVKYVATMHAREGDDANNEGWDHVLGPLAPALQRADFAVVNLETPIVVLKKPERGEMVFNARPALLGALKRVGVDIATFANNHCLDQHQEGITSTRSYLEEAGLLTAGAGANAETAWAPLVVEKSGMRVGILAVTRWLNGFNNKKDETLPHVPSVPYLIEPIIGGRSIDTFLATIRERAAEVDALIVFIHWGAEYKFAPAPEDRKLAQQMIDAGAFAVIGHHPHVLQPIEYLERSQGGRGLVVFSLGNLVSNQDFDKPNGTKRDGLLVELELTRETPESPVRLETVRAIPVATENTLGKGKLRNVQALLLDEELAAIEERLVELAGRTDASSKKERKSLEARRKIGLDRRARIVAFVPAEMIQPPAPRATAPELPGGNAPGSP